jgi:hypothetical protein
LCLEGWGFWLWCGGWERGRKKLMMLIGASGR